MGIGDICATMGSGRVLCMEVAVEGGTWTRMGVLFRSSCIVGRKRGSLDR